MDRKLFNYIFYYVVVSKFFVFIPACGNVPIWRSYFSTLVVQPPSSGLANDYPPVDQEIAGGISYPFLKMKLATLLICWTISLLSWIGGWTPGNWTCTHMYIYIYMYTVYIVWDTHYKPNISPTWRIRHLHAADNSVFDGRFFKQVFFTEVMWTLAFRSALVWMVWKLCCWAACRCCFASQPAWCRSIFQPPPGELGFSKPGWRKAGSFISAESKDGALGCCVFEI